MKVVVCDLTIQVLRIGIKLVLGSYVKCCNVVLYKECRYLYM